MLLMLLILAVTAPPGAAGGESDQEALALELVGRLLAGDRDAAARFLEQHLAEEKYEQRSAEGWAELVSLLSAEVTGGELVAVRGDRDNHLTVVVGAGELEVGFGFEFTPTAPHRITGLGIEKTAGRVPADERSSTSGPVIESGMSDEQIARALEAYLADLADRDVFSGTALVARDGKPIFTAAHGFASHRFRVPNDIDTRFDVGSINKTFTRIAIAQLLAAGKLQLTDTIADHLPDYPNAEVAGRVTVGQLVEHGSGLGDIFNERFFAASKTRFRSPSDYFPIFAQDELLFEPGTATRYSNAGFIVLGAIIERLAGMSYDEFIDRFVFQPAGMRQSGFFARDEPVPNVATGYTRQDGRLRNNTFSLAVKGSPAGSAYCTVGDLLRFDNALRNHELTSPAYTLWVFGGPVPRQTGDGGGASERLAIGAGLAGGAPGVSASMEIETDLVVIVLSNYDAPIAERIAGAVMGALRP